MASVSLITVQRRVISILMANRLSPYAGVIPTPATNSRYQSTQEIIDTILEADAVICQARISTPGDPYRNTWVSFTADLAHAALIPPHIGSIGGVDVKVSTTYTPARFASSKAEILAMRAHPTLYTNAQHWVWLEDGVVYHNGDFARIWRTMFSKSAVCQSPEQDELAVIALTLGSIPKDGAVTPEIYAAGAAYGQWYVDSQIRGQSVTLPEVEQIESRLAA